MRDASDEARGRTVMPACPRVPRHGWQESGRQLLAELDTPLVEGVDVPDRGLDEDTVLVERDDLSERIGIEPSIDDRDRRPVTCENAMRRQARRVSRALAHADQLGLRLHEGASLHESRRLREAVR